MATEIAPVAGGDAKPIPARLTNAPNGVTPTGTGPPEITGARTAPPPRRVPLPLGGQALMYSREQLVALYRCSHGELGRMLRAKMAPLPIRIDGQILWYVDEVLGTQAQVERTLGRWRKR
jgi:hypothetical protein